MKRILSKITSSWKRYRNSLPAKVQSKEIQFGVIDTNTGETRMGYITRGGEMAYEKHGTTENVWKLPVYNGHCTTTQEWYRTPLFGKTSRHTEHGRKAIYREEHKFSNECRYFIGSFDDRIYIQKEAYENDNVIIPL